jgi:hypothetical protein
MAKLASTSIILSLLFLVSCSSVFQDVSLKSSEYKRMMELTVNGVKGVGTIVVPKSSQYKIFGHIHGTAEALFLESCHREVFSENQGEVNYVYTPVAGIEDNRACPMEIIALDKGAKHGLGVVDFQDERHTLPISLYCNGETSKALGVSICQAPIGMVQRVDFEAGVISEPGREECRIAEPSNYKSHEFRVIAGICTVVFQEIYPPNRKHRLTIIGFDRNILQEL